MAFASELIYGWIDYSIGKLIAMSTIPLERYPYCLITSIDSNRNIGTLSTTTKINIEWPECRLQYNAFFVPSKVLSIVAQKYAIFNGFDEVWFFERMPNIQLPDEYWITAPRDLNANLPQGLYEWMKKNYCPLGLGDGIGLNFVSIDQDMVRKIQQISK